MSAIALKLTGSVNDISLVAAIRAITDQSLNAIKSILREAGTVVRYELYTNQHDEDMDKLQKIIGLLKEKQVGFEIIQFTELSGLKEPHRSVVSEETLRNILHRYTHEGERQERLMERGQ